MTRCYKCQTSENLVFSGVDAMVLGVLDKIEKVCYSCALTAIREDY